MDKEHQGNQATVSKGQHENFNETKPLKTPRKSVDETSRTPRLSGTPRTSISLRTSRTAGTSRNGVVGGTRPVEGCHWSVAVRTALCPVIVGASKTRVLG